MPRTSIAVEEVPFQSYDNDITFSNVDAANGMMFPNDGQTVLLVKNADATSKTVTVRSVQDENGRTGDLVVTVAAGKTAWIGPLRQKLFCQRSTDAGMVYVDFSAATSTTVACMRFNP
jgi:hypothetical protein